MLNRACNTAWETRNCQDAHLQNTCDKLYRVLLERIFFTRKKKANMYWKMGSGESLPTKKGA